MLEIRVIYQWWTNLKADISWTKTPIGQRFVYGRETGSLTLLGQRGDSERQKLRTENACTAKNQ